MLLSMLSERLNLEKNDNIAGASKTKKEYIALSKNLANSIDGKYDMKNEES